MSMLPLALLCMLICAACSAASEETASHAINHPNRIALVITLAGSDKLHDYVEWSCRSVGASAGSMDMLIFHESNSRLLQMKCAGNVKLINLGKGGLAKAIIKLILMDEQSFSEATHKELYAILAEIIKHIPRYLVEIKPLLGSLFAGHLQEYSHWAFGDPDTLWGDVADFIDASDFDSYDVISVAKIFDASRLYLRGQFTIHKNIKKVNNIWHHLDYFTADKFSKRIINAKKMLTMKMTSEEVFKTNFHSCEGYYSKEIFKFSTNKKDGGMAVKIVGRSFDDYNISPVIYFRGHLLRVPHDRLLERLRALAAVPEAEIEPKRYNVTSVRDLHPANMKGVKTYHHKTVCRMQWLPLEVRQCVADETFSREDALENNHHFNGAATDSSHEHDSEDTLRLNKVGEAALSDGHWSINDELETPRQITDGAMFFHFKEWFEVSSVGPAAAPDPAGCAVLYLRPADGSLSLEPCGDVLARSSALSGLTSLSGGRLKGSHAATRLETISKTLAERRREREQGSRAGGKEGRGGQYRRGADSRDRSSFKPRKKPRAPPRPGQPPRKGFRPLKQEGEAER